MSPAHLDISLKFIASHLYGCDEIQFRSFLNEQFPDEQIVPSLITEKLNRDRYITIRVPEIKALSVKLQLITFSVTYEGIIFNKKGGYIKSIKRQNTAAFLQSFQAWIIAIGTLFAGLYGIYEVVTHVLK